MDRRRMRSLFRRLRAEASTPRRIGEEFGEADARLDRIMAQARAVDELAATDLGPLVEPVSVPPALEARLARCFFRDGEAPGEAPPRAREARPWSSTTQASPRFGRPTLLRSDAEGGDPGTSVGRGLERGRSERGRSGRGAGSTGSAASEGAGRLETPRPASTGEGAAAGFSLSRAPGADRPIHIGRASAAVREVLARHAPAPVPSSAGESRGGRQRPAIGAAGETGRVRAEPTATGAPRGADERERRPGWASDASPRRPQFAPDPVLVPEARTRLAAATGHGARSAASGGSRSAPSGGSRAASSSGRRSAGPPSADSDRAALFAATGSAGAEPSEARPAFSVAAVGPTGLRALAALRDGPLEDPRPEGSSGARSSLDVPGDRDLPPLLRERAREKELAHVLGRALRAEAARHGIEVEPS